MAAMQAASASRTLAHVTVETGHVRQSPRHEVDEAVLDRLKSWLTSALRTPLTVKSLNASAIAAVPGRPGFVAVLTRDQKCLWVTLVSKTAGPCVTFCTAPPGAEGASAWEAFVGGAQRPDGAWCAVQMDLGLLLSGPKNIGWMGDFERCVAWAWLDQLDNS